MPQNSHPHKPFLVQAPVKALDPDGTAVITAGTAGFAVAAGVCALQWDALVAAGETWHLGVAVAGLVIGGLGMVFSWRRHHRRRRGLTPAD